jgi:hypothetical protein
LAPRFAQDAAKCPAKRKQAWRWPGAKRGIAIEHADAVDVAEGNITAGVTQELEGEAR